MLLRKLHNLNGISFHAPEEEFADMVLDVARGKKHKSDVARYIRH